MRKIDKLISAINKFPNGTKLIIKWGNGLEIVGEIDTIYETNNSMEIDEDGYEEYDACAFLVLAFLKYPLEKPDIEEDSLIEISMQNPPLEVQLANGSVIWKI